MGKTNSGKALPLRGRLLLVLIILTLGPLLLVYSLLYLVWTGILTAILYLCIWLAWGLRGQSVLLVYSDSPVWKGYFEEQIVPPLSKISVILNWSERKRWRLSLAAVAFRHFAGQQEFNPIAIVFHPFHLARRFRFYEAFKDFKHGRTAPLELLKQELLEVSGTGAALH